MLLGESLSGKSVLLLRIIVDVSDSFGVILYNDGRYVMDFSPESLKGALESVSEKWKVLVVVDDFHNLPQMSKVVNEMMDEGKANITFLLAARQPNFDNIRNPFGLYRGRERYEGAAEQLDVLLEKVKVFDEKRLRLSKNDIRNILMKYSELFDDEIPISEEVIELLADKFNLAGELVCYLVFKKDEGCVNRIFRRIEDELNRIKKFKGEEVGDRLRKVYIMSFLMKLAGVVIKKDAVFESADVEEGDFDMISGTFLFPSNGFIETINEEFAAGYLEEFRRKYSRKFKKSVKELMEKFKSFCSGEKDYYVAFTYGVSGRIHYGRGNLDLLLDVLDSLNFDWLDKERKAKLNFTVGTAYAIATDFFGRNKAEEAKRCLEKAADLGIAKAHYNLAVLLQNKWDKLDMDEKVALKGAKKHYEKAIDLKKDYAKAHYNLALLLEDKWDKLDMNEKEALKGAKKHFEKAADLGIAEAHHNLALLLQNKWDKLGMKKEDAFDKAENHIAEAWKKRENYQTGVNVY